MLKKILLINLLIIVTTCLEVIWASPDALSAVDMSTSPIDYIEWLCLWPSVTATMLFLIFRRFSLKNTHQIIIGSLSIMVYWIFINHSEFDHRVAGWSTFSSGEIWYYVFITTVLPLAVCIFIFTLTLYIIVNKKGHTCSKCRSELDKYGKVKSI